MGSNPTRSANKVLKNLVFMRVFGTFSFGGFCFELTKSEPRIMYIGAFSPEIFGVRKKRTFEIYGVATTFGVM